MINKKLRTIGNSYGIVIPKVFLEEMGINPVINPEVEIEVVDKVLRVKKAVKSED